MEQMPMSEGRSPETSPADLVVQVGTIAARNYLASVILLGESLRRVMPQWRLSALLIDASDDELVRYRERWPWMDFLAPSALALAPATLWRMQLYYDLTEFATAIKPSLLSLLLGSSEVAIYLDPDIEVFASLEHLAVAARQHGIALTPHVMAPSPRDGRDTSEEAFLTTGQFNLGFIAVSRDAAPFLGYWAERLERHARIEFARGYFTDQKWVDAVPSLFDHEIVRDSGCNVAYWNLHQRVLSEAIDGSVLVDGQPLRFFHYSGHDARDPLVLSKYAPNTRVSVSASPVLRRLLVERAARISAVEVATPTYRWSSFPDGRAVPAELRRGYWHAVDDALRNSAPLPPAPRWDGASPDFDAWLEGVGRSGIPRQALLFWRGSEQAQQLFPDPERLRSNAFSTWVAGQPTFAASAAPGVLDVLRRSGDADVLRPLGVNVMGYLAGEFGMGEHARNLASSVRAAGLPVATVSLRAPGHAHGVAVDPSGEGARYALNLVVVNADVLGDSLLRSDEWSAIQPRPTVGVWAWELPEMPRSMASASRALDEIWCGSTFVRDALLGSEVTCPVEVHPWLVEAPQPTHLLRRDLGLLDDRFLFGFAFDVRSVVRRKNPAGLLEAYLAAFGPDDGAGLVLKTLNAAGTSVLAELADHAEGRADIQIIDATWSTLEMRAFYQLVDCYVSLHRSEGTGLTMLDAMAAGTPVIATGYSGNIDFMDAAVSRLVPFDLVEVGPHAAPYPSKAWWADPDLDAASVAMRELATDRELARALGASGAAHVAASCSRQRAARWVADRFDALVQE